MIRTFRKNQTFIFKKSSYKSNKILEILIIIFILYFVKIGNATNLAISNVVQSLPKISEETDQQKKYTLIKFDLSWDQSWRNGSNWDAVWVFGKYRVGNQEWKHASLNYINGSASSDGHIEPARGTISTPPDGKGVFIYRTDVSEELTSVEFKGIEIRWNHGFDDLEDNSNPDIRLFGLEMVFIPENAFAVGNEGSEFKKFNLTTINTADASIAPKGAGGMLDSPIGGYPVGETQPDSSNWPNGFNAFYCMKFELNQGQYADFLNTITPEQAANRFSNRKISRYGIRESKGTYLAALSNRACNFLSWADGAAYCDWAACRPLTELEFEKACRGTLNPVADEYAWGTNSIKSTQYILENEGTGSERVKDEANSSGGNAAYNLTNGYKGPYSCGIFALSSLGWSRESLGSSFYGVMELSGNLWERPITISHTQGRKFTGVHGDGFLTVNTGDANVTNWPGPDAIGVGFRGGGWRSGSTVLRVSDRVGANDIRSGRSSALGFRGVRTAPS